MNFKYIAMVAVIAATLVGTSAITAYSPLVVAYLDMTGISLMEDKG